MDAMERGLMLHRLQGKWGYRLFFAGIALMCSPVITVLFAEPVTILVIVYAGAVVTAVGMFLELSG
jgi:hypothetical protein